MHKADSSTLLAPYGESLIDLLVPADLREELKVYADHLPSIQISPRSVCDLELLTTGVFSPLDRFMTQEDYEMVLGEMRLGNGYLFPIPITLSISPDSDISLDRDIALRNSEFELLGIMSVEEIYPWDRNKFTEVVFGTQSLRHPTVNEMQSWGDLNISGRIQVLQLPRHFDFQDLRQTPNDIRVLLSKSFTKNVLAIQHRRPEFRDIEDLTSFNSESFEGTILLQLAVGMTKLGDFDYFNWVNTYQKIADKHFEPDQFMLNILPYAPRQAGPREALLQILIQRNFGANHALIGQDQASPINSSGSQPFYKPFEAYQFVKQYSDELGMKILPSQRPDDVRGVKPSKSTSMVSMHPPATRTSPSSNTNNSPWLHFQQDVVESIAEAQPEQHSRGVCIWFTGLSGSGKSTTAEMLSWMLLEHGRRVTVLDGDIIRTHLSKGLGFSKKDRDINVRRIGYVASELVRLGGIVICAVVSPYLTTRNDVRRMVGEDQFIEVFVDTPLEICEARDVKSIYAKVRSGAITGVTGIDDPYEPPLHPEITLKNVSSTPEENANLIIKYLIERGFI